MVTSIANRQIKNGAVSALKVDATVITADGAHAFTGSQSFGGNNILNLATPSSSQDGANKSYVDTSGGGGGGGGGGTVSDDPYNSVAWNGVGNVAPSQNAIRDMWVTLGTAAFTNSSAYDTAGAAATVQTNLNTHTALTNNPHNVTKTQVGLSNVDNTSDVNKPVSTAQQTAINNAVIGLWDYKGALDCSTNPNYPVALKGDTYNVSVAGRIGGASGIVVSPGDIILAVADNAGGTQVAVGSSWLILEANIPGITTVGNNLITTIANGAIARFIQINNDNTVTAMDAATFRAAIGVGAGTGDVVGPAGVPFDGGVALYNTTTGKQIKADTDIRVVSPGVMIATAFRANSFYLREMPSGTEGGNTVQVRLTGALTAPRTLDISVADSSRTLTINGNASISGTNTGDQTLVGLGGQPLDATLTALAGLTITANTVIIGTGTDAFSVLTLNSNTILGRSSAGGPAAQTVTDFAFSLLTDATAAAMRTRILPSKTGNALKVLRVNAGETDFELAAPTGGGVIRIVRETPTGTINGTNPTFTLANTPTTNSEEVFLNGILLDPGAGNDYTITGATITMLIIPVSGDKLRVSYTM